MTRRVPRRNVAGLGEVKALAAAADHEVILIFDADNTLVPQGVLADEFAERVNKIIDEFEALENVARMIVLTNGPPRGVDRIMSRGNKPWTSRRRLGLVGSNADVWVIGDQVLTDGLLAWRLGGTYLHRPIAETGEERRQAVMRSVGKVMARMLFSDSVDAA